VINLKKNDHYAQFGGTHFVNNVPPEEINQFVRQLPMDKRDSLFEVLTELNNKGLITVQNDGIFADGHGEINKDHEF
jgi:hypothetical protein